MFEAIESRSSGKVLEDEGERFQLNFVTGPTLFLSIFISFTRVYSSFLFFGHPTQVLQKNYLDRKLVPFNSVPDHSLESKLQTYNLITISISTVEKIANCSSNFSHRSVTVLSVFYHSEFEYFHYVHYIVVNYSSTAAIFE